MTPLFFLDKKHMHHKGISELVATVLLVLIVTSLMTTVYYVYNRSMNSQSIRINAALTRIKQENSGLDLIDSYYLSSNQTLVICLYLRDNIKIVLVDVYIDYSKVNSNELIYGFNEPLTPQEINCLKIRYNLASGQHQIVLVSEEGARYEYTITTG
ncbi:MAG: hypothetical protein GSR79_08510 [Desulfurococcales archaeon]|nr:hypothetical protein [Desulfurococcales archaeon]